MSQAKESPKEKQIIFGGRFILKKFSGKIQHYNVYHGVNLQTKEQVTAYVKLYRLADSRNGFCKAKLDLYAAVPWTPKLLWSGDERINSIVYRVEVFEKLGPSLEEIMKMAANESSNGHTPHVIIYNIVTFSAMQILLLEKLHECGVVYRYLSPNKIFFSKQPQATELYLAEFIESHRKGDPAAFVGQKYSSIGSHLGLRTDGFNEACAFKDDWQSLCYIIIDIFTQGAYFQLPKNLTSTKKAQAYFTRKNQINPMDLKSVPLEYINFCMYVRNLSAEQEPVLQHWKKQFRNYFLLEELKIPYCWVPRRHQSVESAYNQNYSEIVKGLVEPPETEEDDILGLSSRELQEEEETLGDKLSSKLQSADLRLSERLQR